MIEILMAVYNGEKYIGNQIESLLNQSAMSWSLLIRDDGSTDKSLSIIRKYAEENPNKIRIIKDNIAQAGACRNFIKLLDKSVADYVMFVDQDDVWLPDKIEKTLSIMKSLEGKYGKSIPILVHTDLKVADKNLSLLNNSFWKYQKVNPEKSKNLNRLLVKSIIRGCTVMINKALRDLSLPIPQEAIMHDHWLSLVASAFGKVGYLNEPTMYYRLHDSNHSGGKQWNLKYVFEKILTKSGRRGMQDYLLMTQKQAAAFADRFRQELDRTTYDMVRAYAEIGRQNIISRRYRLIKYGFYNIGFVRNIGMFIFI